MQVGPDKRLALVSGALQEGGKTVAFLVDLHVHTREASACASQSVEELLARAEQVGLGGVAITDHNQISGAQKGQRSARRRPIKVFMGIEVQTEEIGDVLVYGLRHEFPDAPVSMRRLARLVEKEKAIMFAAHPFRRYSRGALWGYLEDEGISWKHSLRLPELLWSLAGVEVFNGGCTPQENEEAQAFATRFRLKGIAGSDAHGIWRVGWSATEFPHAMKSDEQLVEALREGKFKIRCGQTEFESDKERKQHLKAMAELRGQELVTYVEDWIRRKSPKK